MGFRKKIAVILSRFPYPLDKGDKLRAFHQLRYLSQYHDIYLFCLSTDPVSGDDLMVVKSFCKQVSVYPLTKTDIAKGILFSLTHNYPVQVGYFFCRRIKKAIDKAISEIPIDTVYCQLSRTALYGRDLPHKKVIDLQDAFSVNYQRIAQQSTGIQKIFYNREHSTMKKFEQQMLEWFTESTIISAFDRNQVSADSPKLHVVPNGVDTGYFSPVPRTKKFDLLFTGNHSYLPNRQAVFFLHDKILPLLVRADPRIRIHIAGAGTPPEIMALQNKNFTVSGYVSDIRDAYNEATLLIAPLFTGAGLQNKILEAMSMQLPCITTSIVNISIGAEPGKEIIVADTAAEFAEKAIQLLTSSELQNSLKTTARKFVEENYSWEKANGKLMELM